MLKETSRPVGAVPIRVAFVPARERRAGGDIVALGELMLDRDAQVRDRLTVALNQLGEALGAADPFRMKEVDPADDRVEGAEVALRCLLEATSDRRLVLLAVTHLTLL